MGRIALVIALFVVVLSIGAERGNAQQSPTTDEAMYLGRMDTLDDMTAVGFITIIRLMSDPRETDPVWQLDMIGQTAVWEALYQHAASVGPPDRFRASHEIMVEAYALYDQSGDQLRLAVTQEDDASLQLAMAIFAQGNARMEEALAMRETGAGE